MGSSGGGNYQQPATPSPPPGMIAGQGQAAPFDPSFVSFLPSDGSMATGLTPEMLAAINRPQAPIPTPGGGAPAAATPSYAEQLRQALAGAGGAAGRPPGAVPGVGGGGGGFGGGAANFGAMAGGDGGGSRPTRGQMVYGPQMQRLSSQMVNLPAPTGSNISPADVAAYQKAQQGQQGLRDQLAALQTKNRLMGNWRAGAGGSR